MDDVWSMAYDVWLRLSGLVAPDVQRGSSPKLLLLDPSCMMHLDIGSPSGLRLCMYTHVDHSPQGPLVGVIGGIGGIATHCQRLYSLRYVHVLITTHLF